MQSKQAYEDKVKAQMEQVQADMDKLRARMKEADADTRISLEEDLATLEAKQEALSTRFSQLRGAGSEALDDMKRGFEEAFDDLKKSFDSAYDKLKG